MFPNVKDHHNIDDFIFFADLLLRWPDMAHYKVTEAVCKKKVKVYFIENMWRESNSIMLKLQNITDKIYLHVLYFMGQSGRIIFKKKDIEKIEKNNFEISKILMLNYEDEYKICTLENIESIAAFTIFLICRLNSRENKSKINKFFFRKYLSIQSETSECPRGPVMNWKISRNTLWSIKGEMILKNVSKVSHTTMPELKQVIQALFDEGREYIEIVQQIFIRCPGLTNAQLGELFPHDPSVEVAHTGKQSRGKHLKKRLFACYPELAAK